MPLALTRLMRLLLRAGYVVQLRRVHQSSYQLVVLNALEQPVGDIEYRSAQDEPNPQARGLSYAGYVGAFHIHDPVLVLLRLARTLKTKEERHA